MLQYLISDATPFILTDGGIETTLIFDDGIKLPHFAAFTLLENTAGTAALNNYYERHIAVAEEFRCAFILESPTWRASPDWAELLGYAKADLARANRTAIKLMRALRDKHQTMKMPMLISGCVGPRGDGYVASALMRPEAAQAYHDEQISVMACEGTDIISAITMTNAAEAIGIARAAACHDKPCVISFTVETDGRLPTGQSIGEAISETDAFTGASPLYYMINCAHPTHFAEAIDVSAGWSSRVRGLRANASCMSHAELNNSVELDRGDPADLGARYRILRDKLPQLKVLGGCCGTDHTHIAAIAAACQ